MKERQGTHGSSIGFCDAFLKQLDLPCEINPSRPVLKAAWVHTPLGPMLTLADEQSLYLLEFTTRRGLEKGVQRLRHRGFAFSPGRTPAVTSIENELKDYFEGKLQIFKTPYCVLGSVFQQKAWEALCRIPYGETKSYKEQSTSLGKPTAYRAVANANGANRLAIIVPCHRIISSDGTLGGYGGGLAVKEWLIQHEKQYKR